MSGIRSLYLWYMCESKVSVERRVRREREREGGREIRVADGEPEHVHMCVCAHDAQVMAAAAPLLHAKGISLLVPFKEAGVVPIPNGWYLSWQKPAAGGGVAPGQKKRTP